MMSQICNNQLIIIYNIQKQKYELLNNFIIVL